MQSYCLPQSTVMHGMLRISLFLTFLCLAQSPLAGSAQTPPTNITSSDLNTTVVPPTGGSTTTAIRGGTLSPNNANLFHSFGEFSIGQNAIAEFQNFNADGTAPLVSNPASVSNVIGRVTGGNPSNIFGTIDSQTGFPSANLFLINPAGIVFGSGAALNVGGSVNISTADYLRLGTGNEFFYADLSRSSTLSSAPVTAFGFLGATPVGSRGIEISNSASLSMVDDRALNISLVGRDTMDGSEPVPGIRMDQGRINSSGGRISLVSVGTPLDPVAGGEVSAADSNPAAASSGHGFSSLGSILMANNAFLSVSDSSGAAVGEIVIRGGQLAMEQGSRLLARTTDNNISPGLIDIHVTGAMTLTGNDTTIDTSTSSFAIMPAGDILIRADSLNVSDGAQITATNWSTHSLQPRGGNIDITADTVLVTGVFHHPDSGSLLQSGIFSEAKDGVRSGAGQIRITANELSVLDGAAIDTRTEGLGRAGDIEIASTRALVSGTNGLGPSTISSRSTVNNQQSSPQAGGDGGTIRIRTTSLDMRDGGQLNTSTETSGRAGTIDVAADVITIDGGQGIERSGIVAESDVSGTFGGDGGSVNLTATTRLDLTNEARITLSTEGYGAGGTLTIQAGQIRLAHGSQIALEANGHGSGAGDAGDVSLSAGTVLVQDSVVSTRSFGSGDAGTVTISAGNVFVNGPTARIDSTTNTSSPAAGAGGNVLVTAANVLGVDQGTITTSTNSVGNAGSVQVRADQVLLTNGGTISSNTNRTNGGGNGGTVTVTGTGPTALVQLSGGTIKASTTGSGHAGNIVVAGNTVTVSGTSSSIDSSTTGTGNAGNVLVQAGQVTLANGATISSASVDPATGNAGAVSITATGQFQSAGGNITTSADNGQGGDITIRSAEIELNRGATIAADTRGQLDAGNILLVASDRILLQDSSVTTSASEASGGNITLLAPNLIRLRNGQIISSVQGGLGTSGGNITIDPLAVLLQNNSQILARAFQGNGGNISIVAGVLIVEPGSLIDATSQLGVSGQVSVQAPIQSLAGVVNPLPQSFVSNANLYAQHCAANKGGQFSSFVQGSRDGIPPQPGEYLASPLMSDHAHNEPTQSRSRIGADVLSARLGSPAFPLRGDSALRTVSGCKS